MSGSTFQQVGLSLQLIAKLAVLWIALLVLPFAERTLLGAKTYYFLYIGLGLVFVLYGLTIRSVFDHARCDVCRTSASGFNTTSACQKSG